jgi:hypothetical protein
MKRYKPLFKESIQSEKAIAELVDFVIDKLSNNMMKKINNGDFIPEKRFNLRMSFDENKYSNPPEILKEFVNLFLYEFDVILSSDKDKANGVYQSKKNRIVLWNVLFPNTWTKDNPHFEGKKEIKDYFRRYSRGTLIHEFAHAYDDFISRGKYLPKKYKDAPESHEDEKGWKDYAKQNLEVNARYTDWINEHQKERITYTWPEYVKEFKQEWGIKYLNPEQYRRLINRLFAQYNEPLPEDFKLEVLNSLSFKLFHKGFENKLNVNDFIPEDKRWKDQLTKKDIFNYMKKSIQNILTGKVKESEIKNPAIIDNRYAGLKSIKYSFELIDSMEENLKKHADNPDIVKTIQKQIDKELAYYEGFKRIFKLSDEDLKQINDVMIKYS